MRCAAPHERDDRGASEQQPWPATLAFPARHGTRNRRFLGSLSSYRVLGNAGAVLASVAFNAVLPTNGAMLGAASKDAFALFAVGALSARIVGRVLGFRAVCARNAGAIHAIKAVRASAIF